MNEDDLDKVFLLAMKWDWTFVGRFVGFRAGKIVLHQAGYFTRPGKTFDALCSEGFARETQFHPFRGDNGEAVIGGVEDINLKVEFMARWPQEGGRR